MRKILHLTYDMRIGGTEQVIKNIIENVDTSKFESQIYCIEQPLGPWGEQLEVAGVKIVGTNRQPGFDFNLVKSIRAYIKKCDIDVLHCHQYTPYIYGVLAAIGTDTRVIFTEHGRFYPDFGTWKRKLINPLLARMTYQITSISKATKEALIEHENFKRDDIQVIYNSITDVQLRTQPEEVNALRCSLGISDDAIIFGTIARLDPIKNQKMMIRAFSQMFLDVPEVILVIVGDGEERLSLESLVCELGIERAVIFTGYNAAPYVYLNLMDVYLLSSLSEGTSMTLLEAMAASKPCIVTDAGGNAEIVMHDINGIVTPNDNENAFANAIGLLALDKDARVTFGASSRKRFEAAFEISNMVEQYQALYEL